jgi:hypothetical protein
VGVDGSWFPDGFQASSPQHAMAIQFIRANGMALAVWVNSELVCDVLATVHE